MADHIIKVETAMAVMTPYALARSSHHLFIMGSEYAPDKGDGFLIRMYVLGVAIELGLKAAILGEDCTPANKDLLKKLGHDLLELNAQFETVFKSALFDGADVETLQKLNPHFKQKGLEYFTLPVLGLMLNAYKALPSLDEVAAAASKVNEFLKGKDFIIDGKTSHPPSGGIINFI